MILAEVIIGSKAVDGGASGSLAIHIHNHPDKQHHQPNEGEIQ
jgi:hypothetical protein